MGSTSFHIAFLVCHLPLDVLAAPALALCGWKGETLLTHYIYLSLGLISPIRLEQVCTSRALLQTPLVHTCRAFGPALRPWPARSAASRHLG